MPSRYYPQKDMDLIDRFNRELVGDPKKDKCGIIDQVVYVYKVSVYDTATNMYGEASDGKVYSPGIKLNCIIEAEDLNFETDDFGNLWSQLMDKGELMCSHIYPKNWYTVDTLEQLTNINLSIDNNLLKELNFY